MYLTILLHWMVTVDMWCLQGWKESSDRHVGRASSQLLTSFLPTRSGLPLATAAPHLSQYATAGKHTWGVVGGEPGLSNSCHCQDWINEYSVHCANLPEILALVRPPPFLAMPGFLRILLTGQPFLYIIQSNNTFTHFQNSVLYRSICVNQHLHFTLLVNLTISKKKS